MRKFFWPCLMLIAGCGAAIGQERVDHHGFVVSPIPPQLVVERHTLNEPNMPKKVFEFIDTSNPDYIKVWSSPEFKSFQKYWNNTGFVYGNGDTQLILGFKAGNQTLNSEKPQPDSDNPSTYGASGPENDPHSDAPQPLATFDRADPSLAIGGANLNPDIPGTPYAALVSFLELDSKAVRPAPDQVLENFEAYWYTWRRTLGFEKDPTSTLLGADFEKALKAQQKIRERLADLLERSNSDPAQARQLAPAIALADGQAADLQKRIDAFALQAGRRFDFVKSAVSLLRLAPESSFGSAYAQVDTDRLQAQVTRILSGLGLMAGEELWKGLAQDAQWLAAHPDASFTPGSEAGRRKKAVEKVEALLREPSLQALYVLAGFLRDERQAPPELTKIALGLFNKLAARTLTLKPEMLATFPRLIELLNDAQAPELAARARETLLTLLKLRDGKPAIADSIAVLAPLLGSTDRPLADAVENFLTAQTGQKLGRDPQAWLAWKEKVAPPPALPDIVIIKAK